ncbi:hypothetical protein FB451DRAFT_1170117 [Mycena latifolia]|nr:hypothetical protein FB451DRAFT_1170117 [Mycena latifolia]
MPSAQNFIQDKDCTVDVDFKLVTQKWLNVLARLAAQRTIERNYCLWKSQGGKGGEELKSVFIPSVPNFSGAREQPWSLELWADIAVQYLDMLGALSQCGGLGLIRRPGCLRVLWFSDTLSTSLGLARRLGDYYPYVATVLTFYMIHTTSQKTKISLGSGPAKTEEEAARPQGSGIDAPYCSTLWFQHLEDGRVGLGSAADLYSDRLPGSEEFHSLAQMSTNFYLQMRPEHKNVAIAANRKIPDK